MREAKFNFTISGFLIALIIVGMFITVFGTLFTNLSKNYENKNSTLYFNNISTQYMQELTDNTHSIKNATNSITQESGFLDIVGAFFSSGYSALKTSWNSFSLFNSLMDDTSNENEIFDFFSSYFVLIIIIGIFVGVGLKALLNNVS